MASAVDIILYVVAVIFFVALGIVILLCLQCHGHCIPRTRGSESRNPETTPFLPETSECYTEEMETRRISRDKISYNKNKISKISYNKDDVLGHGISTVYKGFFERKIEVAVKVVKHASEETHTEMSETLDALETKLQLREIKVNQELRKLEHINVATYYGYETQSNRSFIGKIHFVTLIAIEKCDRTLKRVIEERGDYSDLTNQSIFNQTANGLQFLHSRSIVHRDLKPSNILLRIDEKVNPRKPILKLSDFGVSKFLPIDSSCGTLSSPVGTPNWMAPEISSCQSNSDSLPLMKSDIYSLGLIFLYVEVNEDPFIKTDFNAYLNSLKNYTLVKLIEERMCNTNPDERMKTTQLLKHPALWDAEYTLTFFEKASDASKKNKPSDLDNASLDTYPISNTTTGWNKELSSKVASHLSSPKNCQYKFDSVYFLLRAIRNCSHHYRELPLSVQKEFGSYPKEFISYWTLRFPKLLLHVYDVMQNEVKNCQDDDLQKYY